MNSNSTCNGKTNQKQWLDDTENNLNDAIDFHKICQNRTNKQDSENRKFYTYKNREELSKQGTIKFYFAPTYPI